ncbi:MAG: homoserine dehydrogenase [Fusobacterium sp. JB021]|nr:homoserine dehydrogenase [Fusobacterium sp. JB021]MDP0506372.1 homoserine dehydrogenase [Fusobacterium sp. JB019]
MKVGLFGFGVVGRGIFDIIETKKTSGLKRIEIKKALVSSIKGRNLDILTINPQDIIQDKEIDTVVEVMGGINPAYDYIISSLKAGKNVVTANKAVVAKHFKEFVELAKEYEVKFYYEPSVCGGVPIIEGLKKVKKIDEVSEIGGIFNGTTNFILDKMTKFSAEFKETLEEAQEKGYAEADPSADIDGIDILRKIMISTSIAFDFLVPEKEVNVFGIRNILKIDIDYFKEKDKVVKLMAVGKKKEDKYICCVEPVAYNFDEMEATVPTNFNIAFLKGDSIGELKFFGQGAGKYPTGNAGVQDLIDILEKKEYDYPEFKNKLVKDPSLVEGKYYIRTRKKINETRMKFIDKQETVKDYNVYTTKNITNEKMCNILKEIHDENAFFVRIN